MSAALSNGNLSNLERKPDRIRNALFNRIVILCCCMTLPGISQTHPDTGSAIRGSGEVILEDMVVTTSKTVIDRDLKEKIVFASDVKKLPLIDNDVLRAVQAHPGVSGDDFSARFSVRGGDRDETLVLLDGMEIFFPFHLQDYGGALSIIDMLAVKKARLYLGGHPPQYGDRLSAVLDVETRTPSQKNALDAGVDLLNAHFFIDKRPVFASVRAGYIGLFMEMIQSDEKLSPHYGDVLLRIDHPMPGNRQLSSYLLYAGDLNTIDKTGTDDDVNSQIQNAMLWSRYRTTLFSGFIWEAYPYGGIYLQERRLGIKDRDDRNLTYSGLKSLINWQYHSKGKFNTGLEYRWMRGKYNFFQADSGIGITPTLNGHTIKGFAVNTWKLSSSLTNEIGFRLLFHAADGFFDSAPYAALSWTPIPRFSLNTAWGLYYQPVDPLNLPVEAGVEDTGPSEKAIQWTSGMRLTLPKRQANFRIEAYFKKYRNLLGFIKDYGRKSRIYWPRNKGRARGFELIVDKGFGDFMLHTGYTWSKSEVTGNGRTFYSEDDRRHAATVGISWDYSQKWDLYLGFNLHTGTPYTDINYVGDVRRIGPPNGERLPIYHSLSLRINRIWLRGEKRIQAYIQVLNLYNRANVHEYTFTKTEKDGKTTFTKQEENLFPILPALGVNVAF